MISTADQMLFSFALNGLSFATDKIDFYLYDLFILTKIITQSHVN